MKAFITFALLVAGVSANSLRFHEKRIFGDEPHFVRAVESFTPVARKHIPILKLTNDIRGAQSNDLKYETGNGIFLTENTQTVPGVRSVYEDEQGRMIESDSSLVKTGSYSYTSPEGLPISVRYTADEDGFHVEGDHLPQPVQLPAEHAEIHRQALARIGLVDPVSPLLIVQDSPAPLRIKAHHRQHHHHRPAVALRFTDSTHAAFRHL